MVFNWNYLQNDQLSKKETEIRCTFIALHIWFSSACLVCVCNLSITICYILWATEHKHCNWELMTEQNWTLVMWEKLRAFSSLPLHLHDWHSIYFFWYSFSINTVTARLSLQYRVFRVEELNSRNVGIRIKNKKKWSLGAEIWRIIKLKHIWIRTFTQFGKNFKILVKTHLKPSKWAKNMCRWWGSNFK